MAVLRLFSLSWQGASLPCLFSCRRRPCCCSLGSFQLCCNLQARHVPTVTYCGLRQKRGVRSGLSESWRKLRPFPFDVHFISILSVAPGLRSSDETFDGRKPHAFSEEVSHKTRVHRPHRALLIFHVHAVAVHVCTFLAPKTCTTHPGHQSLLASPLPLSANLFMVANSDGPAPGQIWLGAKYADHRL